MSDYMGFALIKSQQQSLYLRVYQYDSRLISVDSQSLKICYSIRFSDLFQLTASMPKPPAPIELPQIQQSAFIASLTHFWVQYLQPRWHSTASCPGHGVAADKPSAQSLLSVLFLSRTDDFQLCHTFSFLNPSVQYRHSWPSYHLLLYCSVLLCIY